MTIRLALAAAAAEVRRRRRVQETGRRGTATGRSKPRRAKAGPRARHPGAGSIVPRVSATMPNNRKIRLEPPPSPDPPAYEVGYRKPPAASQFKPGRSGNAKGRPKGACNKRPALNDERLKTIIVDEAYRTIKITEGRRQITIPMAKAVIRSMAVNAARGRHRSQQLFAELLSETERANKASSDEWLKTAIEYKYDWAQELERRERLGVTGPEPLPHPDDIVIDMKTGQVIVKCPVTKEEKVVWDRLRARRDACDSEIEELTAMLKDRKNKRIRDQIENDIAGEKHLRDSIVKAIGEWPKRNGFAK
jgi:Family of unknown function (DUF5681)